MKKFLRDSLPLVIIASLVTLIAVFVRVFFETHKDHKTPISWCVWEIRKHENYDCDFAYTYQELGPKSELEKEAEKGMTIYAYYVTVFADDRMGEWICFIECFHENFFDNVAGLKTYSAKEVYLIDCDIAKETLYE